MRRMKMIVGLALLLFLCGSGSALSAQSVTRCPNPGQSLPDRWEWAVRESARQGLKGSVWIGYDIVKPMRRNAFIGSMSSDARRNSPSLCEVLHLDMCVKEREFMRSMHNFTMMEGMMYIGEGAGGDDLVQKEIAILFEVSVDRPGQSSSVFVSNLSLHADLRDIPLLWLGEADPSESIPFLKKNYDIGNNEKIQKKIISVIGMHEATGAVISFLSTVLEKGEQASLRAEAAFRLGQTNSEVALKLLMKIAENEISNEVREQAIFAIGEMDNHKGTESLITLARTAKNRDARSKAMFWLGQEASEKATETLKEIAEDDEDTEIQKNALSALAESENDGGIDVLINIAKTHRSPSLRKQAIYLLGESNDKRALDALVEIIRK